MLQTRWLEYAINNDRRGIPKNDKDLEFIEAIKAVERSGQYPSMQRVTQSMGRASYRDNWTFVRRRILKDLGYDTDKYAAGMYHKRNKDA